MHEMSIAISVLEAVTVEAARYPGCKSHRVGLRIGELAGIDPESLRFCFQALVSDTELHEIEFEIECCPRHQRCLVCRLEFTVRDYDFQCPQCGNLQTEYVSGDQLELVYLEVEEHEPSSVRAQSS